MTVTLPGQFDTLASLTKREAMIARSFLDIFVREEDFIPLKPVIGQVIRESQEPEDTVVTLRRKLNSKHKLFTSRRASKEDNLEEDEGMWLTKVTEHGEHFFDWLMKECQEWGTQDHPDTSVVRADLPNDWTLGERGFIVEEKLPHDLWRKLSKEIKAKGYRTVIVPPGVKVYVGMKNEEGKPKAMPVPTWEELNGREKNTETDEERANRLEAEVRRLRGVTDEV